MPFKNKEDKARYMREVWYPNNKEKHIRRVKASEAKRAKRWMLEVKSGVSCQRCGEDDPRAIDFHHRDPVTKKATIGQAARKMSRVDFLAEVAKCIPLCANCHRKHHLPLQGGYGL